jgi:hypothetical protein
MRVLKYVSASSNKEDLSKEDGIWKQHILFDGGFGPTNCKGEGVGKHVFTPQVPKNIQMMNICGHMKQYFWTFDM